MNFAYFVIKQCIRKNKEKIGLTLCESKNITFVT